MPTILEQVQSAQLDSLPQHDLGITDCEARHLHDPALLVPFFLHPFDETHRRQTPLGFLCQDAAQQIHHSEGGSGFAQNFYTRDRAPQGGSGQALTTSSCEWYKGLETYETPGSGIFAVSFTASISTSELRTRFLHDLTWGWKLGGKFSDLIGWRHAVDLWRYERIRVWGEGSLTSEDGKAQFEIERAAVPLFGFRKEGVALHVYCQALKDNPSSIKIWVSRRSYQKQTDPGQLDNCVGGTIPSDCASTAKDPRPYYIKAMETEASEEASYAAPLLSRMVPASVINLGQISESGRYKPDRGYTFDLELDPVEFHGAGKPAKNDDEVDEFLELSPAQVVTSLEEGHFLCPSTGKRVTAIFKSYGSNIAMIDFLLRQGCLADLMKVEKYQQIKKMLEELRGKY